MVSKKQKYDVIILGGGIAGLGVACGFLNSSKRVLVIDRKNQKGAASRVAAGMLHPFLDLEAKHPLLPVMMEASSFFEQWFEPIKKRIKKNGYEKTGMLYVAMNEKEEEKLSERYKWQKNRGVRVCRLNKKELKKYTGSLNSKAISGLFYPDVGFVRPSYFLKAIKAFLRSKKIDFKNCDEKPFIVKKNNFYGVQVGAMSYEASCLVNAAGVWSPRVDSTSRALAVEPIRGQIFITNKKIRLKPILLTLSDGYALPWGRGSLFGSTVEKAGYQARVTARGKQDVMNQFAEALPSVKKHVIAKSWAGLRPRAKDGLPIVGEVAKRKGYYVATGYFRSGFLLGPYLGSILAKQIISGKNEKRLERFSPNRFNLRLNRSN